MSVQADFVTTSTPPPATVVPRKRHVLYEAFVFGAAGGIVGSIVTQPFDVIKTRLQTQKHGALSSTMKNMFTNEGPLIFWRGLAPSLLRVVPGIGMYFLTLDFLERNIVKHLPPTELENFSIGLTARALPSVLLLPLTVIKTRFESQYFSSYRSIRSAMADVVAVDGIRGLFCGLWPTVIRDSPASALYLVFYRKQQSFLPADLLTGNVSAPVRFACGINAGIMACVATHPFDMVKTQMQLQPGKYKTMLSTARTIFQKFGAVGFFKGFIPRTMRRAVLAATSWTTFEELLRRFRR